MTPVIPAPVPVPLPAPAWLLQILLVFTFILHVLAMNFLVGGGTILTVSSFLGRRDPRHRDFTRRAARPLPAVTAFTITLGVAPLLFLQLVYGQLFYTSSVLMAWFWLAVVFLVLVGYYAVYGFNLRQNALGPRAAWLILGAVVAFVLVAFVFTQNMTAMLQPQDFYDHFLNKGVGTALGTVTASNAARLLHFMVGAVAVGGLAVALLSRTWRAESPEMTTWVRNYGVKWFMAGTGVELLIGFWFLASLPREIRDMFMGGDHLSSGILVAAMALAVLATAAAPKSLAASSVAIVGTISLMSVLRHLLRVAYLRPYFDPRTLPVEGQWFVFGLFALLLVGGLATVVWMLYVFFRPAAASADMVEERRVA
jgi:hypothetical protein